MMTSKEQKELIAAAEKIASLNLSEMLRVLKEKAIVWKGRCHGS